MRKTLLFLLLLTVKLTFGQFRDNFSDGNFASDPTWVGQTSAFSVNAAKQLKTSLSAVAQTISLSTRSDLALNVSWEFSIQMNFDPSTSNLARIYLVADQSDLSGSLNGYFVQIGESGGADSYDLYRQTGNSVSRIIDCQPKNRANINFLSTKLRVTRTELGKWELHSSSNGGESYMMEGSVTDKTFTSTTSFGVYCKYTASRSDGFMFDDFVVEELIADRTPPQLIAVKVLEGSKVEATFSEAISLSSALVLENYKLKGTDEFPISVSATSFPHVFLLSFSGSFLSAPYTLVASGMYDLKGNVAFVSEATTFYVRPYVAIKGDLVINEIFADPSPAVGLPAVEFVELWNTTNNYLLLRDWKFKDLTATHSFLSDTIRPNEYVVLCPIADRDLFIGYGKTIGLTTWPTLNNDGDRLTLLSGDNVIIDEVSYLQTWYKDPLKDGGGYSLELIDPANRCGGIQNWQASLHPNGGSPGIQNSVYQFQLNSGPLLLVSASFVDEITIHVNFNKTLDSLPGTMAANYSLNNGVGEPLKAIIQSTDFKSVLLKFQTPIPRGVEYVLTIHSLTDCAGGLIAAGKRTAKLFLAKPILEGNVLISEILVNPKLGGVDFIEIYNPTGDTFDLSTLMLANIDTGGNIASVKRMSDSSVYLPSKTFWVLTSDVERIKEQFEVKNPLHFTKMASLPVFANERGSVVLVSGKLVIDRFDYHESMHFQLLRKVQGVSLERVSFEKGANTKGNFKSAAQESGYGTPTYKNTQQEPTVPSNDVWLTNKVFSPDGDGFEDVLQVNYRLVDEDYVATVTICNERGIPVRSVARNATIGKTGYFVWDGLNDGGTLNKIGIYIVKFDVFSLNGVVRHYRKSCVLAAKLK